MSNDIQRKSLHFQAKIGADGWNQSACVKRSTLPGMPVEIEVVLSHSQPPEEIRLNVDCGHWFTVSLTPAEAIEFGEVIISMAKQEEQAK